MNTGTAARYLVEKQGTEGEEWRPVTSCNSMVYARIVANAGVRHHVGVGYRLVDNRTGATTDFFPAVRQQAA